MASETINQFPASGTTNGSLMNTGSISSITNNFPATPSSTMLKLSNIPSDLTQREATIIFSLVIDEIVNIEMKDFQVFAYFKTVNTCITTGKLLDGKFIFGNEFGPVKVEYDNLPINSPNSVANAFGSLRLSNSNVSPPGIVQPTQPTSASSANAGNIQGFDNYQKRQSMGNQRSRFVFSDPFSAPNGSASSTSGGIDLSDLTGKSLLLMESQNDAREYQNLVRDPWNSGNGALPINSAPQTPGISTNPHGAFDWSNTSGALVANPSSDRRRTSSAFFNNPLHSIPNLATASTLLGSQQPNTQQQSAGTQPSNGQQSLGHINIPNQNSVSINQQSSNTSVSQPSNGANQNINQSSQAAPIQSAPIQTPSQQQNQPSNAQNTSINQSSYSSSGTTKPSTTKDVPDLSLLSRVPPPANPADQNPPCNTLYVGNLPPDATEAELRSLFSPQKGFRRLSFRTKNLSLSSSSNSNSHNHGPMCFVEFEDVAHATRALAELYGRALPRPNGGNGKGGIRLSFSKNPLGVRGPGNPRRSSANQVSASNSNSSNNGNGVGNYGYLNYHQK